MPKLCATCPLNILQMRDAQSLRGPEVRETPVNVSNSTGYRPCQTKERRRPRETNFSPGPCQTPRYAPQDVINAAEQAQIPPKKMLHTCQSKILSNAPLGLGKGRGSFNAGVPSCLNVPYNWLSASSTVRTVAIRPLASRSIVVDVVGNFFLVVLARRIVSV